MPRVLESRGQQTFFVNDLLANILGLYGPHVSVTYLFSFYLQLFNYIKTIFGSLAIQNRSYMGCHLPIANIESTTFSSFAFF